MGAHFQNFFNKHIWDFRGSLENINTTINADWIDEMFASLTGTGDKITQKTALTLSAFYRGLRIHGDTVASLPKEILEPDNGGRKKLKDHKVYSLIAVSPNPQMTSFIFYESLIANLFLYGNAFAEIVEKGGDMELWPIESQRVEIKRKKREISYKITDDLGRKGSKTRILPTHKMIHIPLMGLSGFGGLSPIALAGTSLGQGVALQNFVAKFFKNSAIPSGILAHTGPLPQPMADKAKENWQKAQGKKEQSGTAVLPGNWKFQAIQSNAQEFQLNESREFVVLEVARWLGIEPHLLYDLRRATFSNIEEQNIQHTKFTVNGIIKRFEAELERKLFSTEEIKRGLQIRFNVNGLMRGDAASRAEFYRTGIQNGFIKIKEVRELENLSFVEGTDRLFIQQNMMPVDKVDQIVIKQRVNGTVPAIK